MRSPARAPTYVIRGQLPNGGEPFRGLASIPKSLKKELYDYDRQFELHEINKRVHAYRKSLSKSNNLGRPAEVLCYQFTLQHPPGPWLLTLLKRSDMWRQFGNNSKAVRQRLSKIPERTELLEQKIEEDISEVSDGIKGDVENYVIKEKRSFHLGSQPHAYRRRGKKT